MIKNEGEEIAQKFLFSKGYEILERNFHAGQLGEIDIVCRDGDEIVFVEVKMRSSDGFGDPEDAVDFRKLAKIARVAEVYLGGARSKWRIDVVGIKGKEIVHIQDVSSD